MIGMLVEARIADTQHVSIIGLPRDRILREGILPIFERQGILKDIDKRFLSGQPLLPIEQKVPKLGISCLGEHACLTNGSEGAVNQLWRWLHAALPVEDSRRAMAIIIA